MGTTYIGYDKITDSPPDFESGRCWFESSSWPSTNPGVSTCMSGNKKDQPWRTMKYPNYCGQEEGVPNPNIPDSGLFLYGYTNTKNPNRLRGGNADFFLQKASKATWNHGCVTFNCILVPLRAEVEPVPLTLYTDISPAFQPFQTSGPLKDVWFIRAQNIRGFTFLTKLKGEYKSINSTCVVYKLCVFNVSKYGSNEILL